ncbi:ATP-binding cassette domain-containing protein [Rhodoblastus acidophilus]|uniref:ATP-binding cassette domain-containing protein n=1 Tax=Candidatus Rhodoblastus alkanivorans TaxID=2954117 RepID=A0ABS9ZAD8_9HYPH|nr:ABC transporter ATP-binding protein [Candidatus Rhodoblastus alkanivorans]MCI4677220.1 ATP-binding cassette domain-containing protein [Candidatus Rhodoblastus alkanivorans]MCI4684573.1 ATP-binding cassette domain-containing protein [Candidatus Rhodoblastus alkanivorans]MDI4641894.1 ATP-binding cassette domain-containing protein [Rhodoblastus acidophilus]
MSDSPPALEFSGVSHHYGARQALNDVSFSVPQGAFCVLLGLNGAGKSTMFSLITRLFALQKGQIVVFGRNLTVDPRAALAQLGVVFQSRTLDLDLSVAQNFYYHAALHGIGRKEAARRTGELLAAINLADRAKDKVRALSGGQMRRVEIARALLHHPRLLVLDEPTVGLDIGARADILKLARGLVEREGVSVLWATHLTDEVEPGDAVVVLHKGKLRATGKAADLLQKTGAADVRAAFVALIGETDAGAVP